MLFLLLISFANSVFRKKKRNYALWRPFRLLFISISSKFICKKQTSRLRSNNYNERIWKVLFVKEAWKQCPVLIETTFISLLRIFSRRLCFELTAKLLRILFIVNKGITHLAALEGRRFGFYTNQMSGANCEPPTWTVQQISLCRIYKRCCHIVLQQITCYRSWK